VSLRILSPFFFPNSKLTIRDAYRSLSIPVDPGLTNRQIIEERERDRDNERFFFSRLELSISSLSRLEQPLISTAGAIMKIPLRSARAPVVNQLPSSAPLPRATLRAKKRKSRSRLRRERSARLERLWLGRRRKRDSRLIISDEFSQRLALATSTTSLYRRIPLVPETRAGARGRARIRLTHTRFPAL